MVAIKLIVLSLACVCATALSPTAPAQVTRNTIFADERLEGEVFENIDAFDHIDLSPRNVPSPYRLPRTTRPSHYNVHWTIDMSTSRYYGEVEIILEATQADVNEIVIHSVNVTRTEVTLRQGNTDIPIDVTPQPEYHFLRIRLTDRVLNYNAANPVQYTLTVKYNALMRNDMYGIYHSWYRNEGSDSAVRYMATTQFQATAARFALPSYDEPSFKATFDVTITRPNGFKSWFCTRRENDDSNNQSNRPGYSDDVYLRTPRMSTYLLALIVAEYDNVPGTTQNGVFHEVIARPGAIDNGQGVFAQRIGQELLTEMESHTNLPFLTHSPNLKMTQAAIPDFGAGAMENWGLLTYREAYLLHREGETNGYFEQLIAYILSHEIAHMWFGNLVTNDWWDVLWLNEGFARYYQYFLTHAVADRYGLGSRFIPEQMHTSLLTDSSNNPQPLTNPGVGSPAAVSAMFGTLSYNKGAAVIRMTEHLLSTTAFTVGLRNYLRENAFSTAQPIDLFNALDAAGRSAQAFNNYGPDFNFVDYFKSWTEQPGHPVLNVQINHVTGQMTIYQHRFNINTGFSNQDTQYIVPITFATGFGDVVQFSDTKPTHVLMKPVTVIERGVSGDYWTIFNKQQTGYYRVNYDAYSWDLIIRALRDNNERLRIHEYNRAQIVNDVFQFARSGIMPYRRAMNILYFLRQEEGYTPWLAAITGFNWLRTRLHGTPQLTRLNNEILDWSAHVMNQLGYEPSGTESFMRAYLRYQIASWRCNLGDMACRTSARTQFDRLKNPAANAQPVEVYPDNRNWVYCNALRDGNEDDFQFLWRRFNTHNLYTEKILLLQTLGCTSHEASLYEFLDAIFQSNNIIRRQDYNTALSSAVSGNEENTQIVFNYIKQNLPTVMSAYDNSAVTPLSYVSGRLRTEEEVLDFQIWANASREILGNSYNAVYSGSVSTLQSFNYAPTIIDDLGSFFEVGGVEQPVTTTLPPAPPPTSTTQRPDLQQPTTPDFPDSAVSTFASIFLLTFAALAHIIL